MTNPDTAGSASRLAQRYRTFARGSAVAVTVFGCLVLLGWLLDITVLKTSALGAFTTKANSAVAFALVGVSVWLALGDSSDPRVRILQKVCGGVAALVGALTLTQYLFGWNLGIDQLLFTESAGAFGTSAPGRMSPNVALCFTLVGTALLLDDLGARRGRHPAQYFAVPVGAIALLALVGHAYGVQELYGIGKSTLMPVQAGVAFLLLSLALLFARPGAGLMAIVADPGAGGVLARRLLPIALVVPLVLGWIGLWGERAGLYDPASTLSMVAVANAAVLAGVILATARSLNRTDTARRKAQELLRSAEEGFRLMVESVTDYAIVMLDSKGLVVSWNRGAERIKGFTADEIIGQPFSRFYTPEDNADDVPRRDLEIAAVESRFQVEAWRARKDGSRFWADVILTSMRDEDGNLLGFAKVTRDLTERVAVEAELTDARIAAEEASLAKSEFLSSMSHELRTPLNAILGFAQLMESDSPPPTLSQQQSLEQILHAGWYLLKLINEILDLAKIESGQVPLSPEPVSITALLAECRSMIEPHARERAVTLVFPESDAPHFVRADLTRLKQVLINLLSNAIKYNLDGGTVEVSCADSERGRLRVSIRDTGGGLSPEQVSQLFQPFNRLGQEAGGQEGTGIGLVVAKRLVELMGGEIGAESVVGGGSVFWFELISVAEPRLDNDEPDMTASSPVPEHRGSQLHTLLYVEDNPANLSLVEQIIARRPDLRLLTAVNGMTGIAVARASQPDVLLLDVNLPDLSGTEVLRILRADPLTAHIPAIAVTANAMPRDIKHGLQAGFSRYITKPIRVDEFMTALDATLDSVAAEPNAHHEEPALP